MKSVITKAMLREELLNYGVEYSASKFKNTKLDVLKAKLEEVKSADTSKMEKDNGEDTLENMIEDTIKNCEISKVNKEERTKSAVLSNLDSVAAMLSQNSKRIMGHTTTEADRTIAELTEKIDKMENTISALINEKLVAPKTENHNGSSRNPHQGGTVHYNKDINKIRPVGKTANKNGDIVAYFGICESCGEPIFFATEMAYCLNNLRGRQAHYGNCQKAVRNDILSKGGTLGPAPNKDEILNNAPTEQLTYECMYEGCSNTKTFKTTGTKIGFMKTMQKYGIKPICCDECAKKYKAEYDANHSSDNSIPVQPSQDELNNMYNTSGEEVAQPNTDTTRQGVVGSGQNTVNSELMKAFGAAQ